MTLREAAIKHAKQQYIMAYSDELAEYVVIDFEAGYNYANENKWISVKDKLPEKAKPILLYNGNWTGVGYYKLNFEMDIEGEPDWSDETSEYISEVTHWMPLPSPPKQ